VTGALESPGAVPSSLPAWRVALKPIARGLLRLCGWRVEGALPDAPKFVLVVAPHTSNWDGLIMMVTAFAFGLPVRWMGKRELFRGPAGWALTRLGGIAVERAAPADAVREASQVLAGPGRLALVIPPEGTRKRVPHWKMGFYVIARHARVPVVLAFADYRRRVAGIGPTIVPSGNVETDMATIRAFYDTITAKFPANTGEVIAPPRRNPVPTTQVTQEG
jgi:1-acyl-sn-glycerol-3-phosphate acyltransferase